MEEDPTVALLPLQGLLVVGGEGEWGGGVGVAKFVSSCAAGSFHISGVHLATLITSVRPS